MKVGKRLNELEKKIGGVKIAAPMAITDTATIKNTPIFSLGTDLKNA